MTEFTTKEAIVQDEQTLEITAKAEEKPAAQWGHLCDSAFILDSSNRWLAFSHAGASHIRLLGASLSALHRAVQAHESLSFAPLPALSESALQEGRFIRQGSDSVQWPTPEQWARHCGLATSYELSAEEASTATPSDELQTLLFERALPSTLRQLQDLSDTAWRESSEMTLYLSLGFLKWYEPSESRRAHLAPLVVLPVVLQRDELGQYRLSSRQLAPQTNRALQRKLKQTFELELPALSEGQDVDAYCQQVQDMVASTQDYWRVRRYATLCVLPDQKDHIASDLLHEGWRTPNLDTAKLLRLESEGATTAAVPEALSLHPIDRIPDVHERYPLVLDADSAQHSVVIDTVKHQSLVVDAPPGCGRHQTLANVIAANLAGGKRVLLVSPASHTRASVLQHLDAAGLGEACLTLHSPEAAMSVIKQQISDQPNSGHRYDKQDLESAIVRYEDVKNRLNVYTHKHLAPWGKTGLNADQILYRAAKLRTEHQQKSAFRLKGESAVSLTPVHRKALLDDAALLAASFEKVAAQTHDGRLQTHAWYGVGNSELMDYQEADFTKALSHWQTALTSLNHHWLALAEEFQFDSAEDIDIKTLKHFASVLSGLPELSERSPWAEFAFVLDNEAECERFIQDYRHIHNTQKRLAKVLEVECVPDAASAKRLGGVLTHLGKLGVDHALDSDTLLRLAEHMGGQISAVHEISEALQSLCGHAEFEPLFCDNLQGLENFVQFSEQIAKLPESLWPHRHMDFSDPAVDALIDDLESAMAELRIEAERLAVRYQLEQLPTSTELMRYAEILQKKGMSCWLQSAWREARQVVKKLSAHRDVPFEALVAHLPELITYVKGLEALDRRHAETPLVREHYRRERTELDKWRQLREWVVSLPQSEDGASDVLLHAALLSIDDNSLRHWQEAEAQGTVLKAQSLWSEIEALRQHFPGARCLHDPNARLGSEHSALVEWHGQLNQLLRHLTSVVRDRTVSLEHLYEVFGEQMTLIKLHQAWPHCTVAQHFLPEVYPLSIAPGDYRREAYQAFVDLLVVARKTKELPTLQKAMGNQPKLDFYRALLGQRDSLLDQLKQALSAEQQFVTQGRVSLAAWQKSAQGPVQSTIARNQRALEATAQLSEWLEYVRVRDKLIDKGLSRFVDALQAKEIEPSSIQGILEWAIFQHLAETITEKKSTQKEATLGQHAAMREQFGEYDHALMLQQRRRIAHQWFGGREAVASELAQALEGEQGNTDEWLLEHDALLAKATPCVVAAPSAVSLWPKQVGLFDLVVLADAEQLTLTDSAGALLRAKQVLVMGDCRAQQMPWQSDKPQAQADVLSNAIKHLPRRTLSTNYRQPPALMSFANRKFYASALQQLPTPQGSAVASTVWHLVEHGRYSQFRNVAEAQALIEALAIALSEAPTQQLMVLGMNREQVQELQRQWLYRCQKDSALQAHYQTNLGTDTPLLFGTPADFPNTTRQQVYVSFTFAPNRLGDELDTDILPHGEVGSEQLRLLSTRATEQLHIFSSLQAHDIEIDEYTRSGVRAWREYLQECESGQWRPTLVPVTPLSDLQEQLVECLGQAGYLTEVPSQSTAYGEHIELLVRDPLKPARCLMAILTETSHNESARERERLFPEQLQNMGWMLWRLSAEAWYRDADTAFTPLLEALESLRTPIEQVTEVDILLSLESDQDIDARGLEAGDESGFVMLAQKGNATHLTQRLFDYDKDVLQTQYPDIPDQQRLLRPVMVETLLYFQPLSEAEFFEVMPEYLVASVDPKELSHVKAVVSLIADVA